VSWRPALAFTSLCLAAQASWALPRFDEVKAGYRSSETLLLDRDGVVLQRLRTDATVRRGQWVPLPEVSPALRQALLLSEDKRFYEHSGVDWRAVSAAAWGNLWNRKTRGASTLTMQLAGLLDEADAGRAQGGRRSLGQKVSQAISAQNLEQRWRKDQILEAYLNLLPLRGELVGLDALSRTLFDKAPQGLNEREAAITAALVRAPNASAQQVAHRACGVLRELHPEPDSALCEDLYLSTADALKRRAFETSAGIAPHAARQLIKPGVGAVPATVRSSLRAPLQRMAQAALQRQLRELQGRNVADGAVLVLDNASGEVLAWVGSSGELSHAAEVDGVLAQRQAGSTLKPFLYAQAIAEQRLTAASLLEDSATQIPTASGLYIPQNYDHQFKGYVSVRTALGASLNVPAVRTLVMVSPDAFHHTLGRVGLPLRESGDYFGYSLALGSAEVPLLNLTNAYRTLANGGRFSATSLTRTDLRNSAAPSFTPALDPRAAYIVSDILSDANARARTFGSDSLLATRFWTAVKTGTSKDMRDNWAIGYSQRYTVGVWVGNANGQPMWDVSGTSGAAPVWAAVMGYLHQREPSHAPTPPAGLARVHTEFGNGLEAARDEWFIPGTEQTRMALRDAPARLAAADRPARITAPAAGTIVALDPDIPPQHQRLAFTADGSQVRWRIDGKPLASGPQALWLPWPGKHVVQLADARGTVLDEIKIEVRGAGVKTRRNKPT
jgi:penicillin-binding protein 1C